VLRALHTITSYPPDLRHPVFAHYPAMKYGERPAIDHYARLLAPLAGAMITQKRSSEWVMASRRYATCRAAPTCYVNAFTSKARSMALG